MSDLFPVELYDRGYTDLISVVPPNGPLSPGSKITADQRGKCPGRRLPNGTWAGYAWRTYKATRDEVRHWAQVGANVGVRAGAFPGLDIDSMDPEIVEAVSSLALTILGPAPARVGNAPKRLLTYRSLTPFARMRLWLKQAGTVHLIELLGEGQQYLVHGVHPKTMRPYAWLQQPPKAAELTAITPEQVDHLFAAIRETFEPRGFVVSREGDGRRAERQAGDQEAMRAPSMDDLAAAVAAIPNTFETREEYVRFGYAVKAAAGDNEEDGFELFAEWAARWQGGHNEPETVRSDWRRMHPPYSVGWGWLVDQAREHGFSDASDAFGVLADGPRELGDKSAEAVIAAPRPQLSDVYLAREVTRRIGDRLRYVAQTGQWLVWDGARWQKDDTLGAQAEIGEVLRQVASEQLMNDLPMRDARRIESARTLFDVMKLARADRNISVTADALDADSWLLNTPAGVVELKSGKVTPARPEQLHTKTTTVGPDMAEPARWMQFLRETTGNDGEMIAFLQRLAGYCLTGSTAEQKVTFVWGPGGNGKSVFVNCLREIMGNYATVSSMDTFTSSSYDRHSTELAALCGARLVTANETQAGRQWDEQRIKSLSGGDAITARFMRQDNFTFKPLFKLLFCGNHQPNLRNLDEALRRRINMVPFVLKPEVVDTELAEKLKAEYPAILGWMIKGCQVWREQGLCPPAAVLETTTDYFDMEDSVSQWVSDSCVLGEQHSALSTDLFQSWREWCGEHGEKPGLEKTLVQALRARGFAHVKDQRSRRGMFLGIAPNPAPNMRMGE